MSDDEMEEVEIEMDQYLVFTVKAQQFGFQAMRIQEILPIISTTQVPIAPSYIEGIMNLRGRLTSVVNFRKKFGFEETEYNEDTRIIIVEQDGFPIGVIVDSVEEVMKIPDDTVQKVPESISITMSDKYITGMAMLDGRVITLLNVDAVLTTGQLPLS